MKYSKLAGLLLASSIGMPAMAQIDLTTTSIVSAPNLSARYLTATASPSNVSVTTDPTNPARPVLQLTVNSAQANASGVQTVIYPINADKMASVRWYAISVMFPASWVARPTPAIVASVDVAASIANMPPPVALVVRGSNLEIALNANYRPATGTNSATVANSTAEIFQLGPVKTNKWYCMVVRSQWSPSLAAGNMTTWLNGDKIYDSTNLTNSFATAANIPKVGLAYNGLMDVTSRAILTDFIRLGNGTTVNPMQMYAVTPCSAVTVQK